MSKFKTGDRVVVLGSHYANGDGEHRGSLNTIGLTGRVELEHDSNFPYRVFFDDDNFDSQIYIEADLKLEQKTMETLVAGDVLVKVDVGKDYEVLFANGKVVIINDGDDDECVETLRQDKLESLGYKVKQVEEVKELTVADVEALVGQKVKIVK